MPMATTAAPATPSNAHVYQELMYIFNHLQFMPARGKQGKAELLCRDSHGGRFYKRGCQEKTLRLIRRGKIFF
jgi:hypothetical protein